MGLRVDFSLKNRLKQKQLERIKALESADTEALDSLGQKLDKLEVAIDSVVKAHDATLEKHLQNNLIHSADTFPKDVQNNNALFETKVHEKGFTYLPNFKHVLFPLNSSYFDYAQYGSRLSDLAVFLQQNPNYKIKLIGYADARTGSNKYNLFISSRRAKRVYDYLINLGVSPRRMVHMSYGGTLEFSIGNDITNNRRTEILIFE